MNIENRFSQLSHLSVQPSFMFIDSILQLQHSYNFFVLLSIVSDHSPKMTDTLGEFGGFKTSSFYGKPLSDNVFTLRFHTPRIEQTYQSPSNKRSRSLSVDSRKAKKVKTSLFSGVGHGLKKPKPKKTETKKYVNTDTDKVLKSNKKRKQNEKASKENKPLNQTQKTPIKDVKSASAKKSSNKKNKDDSVEVNDDSFRYRFQVTPDHMKVPKVLPYSG